MGNIRKTGFGGGCHWCTEAVFQSLRGVLKVEQGYVASVGEAAAFSEAVIVHYDPVIIPLRVLTEIHLHTHNATSAHSFRKKYRSAIYYTEEETAVKAQQLLQKLQKDFDNKLVTKVLPMIKFKASRQSLQDYYLTDPDRPFCKRYIHPKLKLLREKFSGETKEDFLKQ